MTEIKNVKLANVKQGVPLALIIINYSLFLILSFLICHW